MPDPNVQAFRTRDESAIVISGANTADVGPLVAVSVTSGIHADRVTNDKTGVVTLTPDEVAAFAQALLVEATVAKLSALAYELARKGEE